jgi:2'-5' RNA ligase
VTTIGVSVAVPDPWGTQLQDYRVRLGDTAAAWIPTHITLLPPLEVEEKHLPSIHEHLAGVATDVEPFVAQLRSTGTFRPVSPVVFVNLVRGISSCELLAAGVRRGPLAVDSEFPYHPHVTVAHHLDDDLLDQAFDDLAPFECAFLVERFSLYEQDENRGWLPVRHFTLHQPAGAAWNGSTLRGPESGPVRQRQGARDGRS